ncbi:MAG: hypothetical protein ACI9QN_001310 [Arcticibacterium sp.]|jgi:hypothetical protein
MPANLKYLSSGWLRAGKVSAAILGSYILLSFVNSVIGSFMIDKANLILTSVYSSFFLWIGLMIMAFLAKKAWTIWAIYLGLSLLGLVIIYLRK